MKATNIAGLVHVAMKMAVSKTDEIEQLIKTILQQSCLIDDILVCTRERFGLKGEDALISKMLSISSMSWPVPLRVKNHCFCHVAEDCARFHSRCLRVASQTLQPREILKGDEPT
eukprot:3674743-Amphidinium_carterae.1